MYLPFLLTQQLSYINVLHVIHQVVMFNITILLTSFAFTAVVFYHLKRLTFQVGKLLSYCFVSFKAPK